MKTPIHDFIVRYNKQNPKRFHMPGHKGASYLGCEAYDITEIVGADSLYEAHGIIKESELNASRLLIRELSIQLKVLHTLFVRCYH